MGSSPGRPSWSGYTDAIANANSLTWKLKLMAEIAPGEHVEIDVATWERTQEVSLATLGLSLEEGKKILAEIQRQMVATQMAQRAQAERCCANCGRSLRNKGHHRSTFHSTYGNVPVRIRRVLPPLRALARRSPIHAQILHLAGASLLGCQTGRTGAVRQSG